MALPPILDEENLYKFRTKICERYVKQGKCEFADKCQYSHDLRWTRRPPWKYTYSPELCRDLVFVTDGRGRTIAKSNCKQKRNCRFAHTKEEQMYHPKVYKTAMCHQFKANGWCDRYYCPFAHSEAELRPTDQTDDSRKTFSKPAVQEAFCPDIYLPSDRPHPRLRARFLAIMDGIPSQNHLRLVLDPNYLSNAGGARTRQPYTDFISSHTPHSVLSEGLSPVQSYGQQKEAANNNNALDFGSGNVEGPMGVQGCNVAKNSTQHILNSRQQSNAKDALGDRRNQRTTSRLVQLLQAKQYAGINAGTGASKSITSSVLLPFESYLQTAHADGARTGVASALTTISDVPPCASAYASTHSAASAQQWTGMPISPLANRARGPHGNQNTTFDGSAAAALFPSLVQQGSQNPNPTTSVGVPGSGSNPLAAGGLGSIISRTEGWLGHQQAKSHMETTQPGELPGYSSWSNVGRRLGAQGEGAEPKAAVTNDFRVKCLTSDICYWNEPIGRSRDDPSVLVYAGLVLGPGKTREVVAVKQLPVVVLNRAAELWREVQRFLTISDPQLVNIKRALLLPGEADEGTSLWVITEKCQGSIVDLFPGGMVSSSFLQAGFPSTGLNGLLHYILRSVQTLHNQSKGAHMRIHPGNIMVGGHGEVKLGDCAGKIRYLSILDLLHAGIQGASNAKALLQWILGMPQETCWMAPELLISLLDLDEELSQALWNCGALEEGKTEQAFAALAQSFRWPVDFLRRADAWSAGATLYYIASGGLHPYGNANDPMILANILADKKLNFDKMTNCLWLTDLLAGLLCHKPAQRLSVTQALHHPLFWTSEDIEKYLEDLRTALEQPRTEESEQLQDALSYSTNWVESLPYIPSPAPLLPLLLSYMAVPSASPLLLAAHPHQTASSFLVFLACIACDKRIELAERRLIVSECLMAHAAPFLHSVHTFLFPKFVNDSAACTNNSWSLGYMPHQGCGSSASVKNTEGPGQLSGVSGVPRNAPSSTRPTISFPSRTAGIAPHPHPSHNIFRQNLSGGPSDPAGNTRSVPPPPGGPGINGAAFRDAGYFTCGEDARPEFAAGPQRRDIRNAAPLASTTVHSGSTRGQEIRRAAGNGNESMTEVEHRAALAGNLTAQQVHALMKEATGLRLQPKRSGLRAGRETNETERTSRPEGSPSTTARLVKEAAKKANKSDVKQKSSGVAKELRWPSGRGSAGGTKQQNEPRQPLGAGKVSGVWEASTGIGVDGTPDAHISKPMPVDAASGQQGTDLQNAETKVDSDPGNRTILSKSAQDGSALSTSQTLPPCPGPQAKSARVVQGGNAHVRAYGDEAGPRRGVSVGHTEIKFSIGSNSALLQMPVAVSSVSTALSSATASDFCHGHSQPTDNAGEAGAWRHEPTTSSVEGTLTENVKLQETKENGRHDDRRVPLDAKTPETASGKRAATVEGRCQTAGDRDDLRRDGSNACSIQ